MTRLASIRRRFRRFMPRTFQSRLTIGFLTVIALTLGLVGILVVNRLDDFFSLEFCFDYLGKSFAVMIFVLIGIKFVGH